MTVMAVPHEGIILRYRIDDSVAPGEHLFEVPSIADLLAFIEAPAEATVVAAIVAVPDEVIILRYRVDDSAAAGEHLFEVPFVTDLLAFREGPSKTTIV